MASQECVAVLQEMRATAARFPAGIRNEVALWADRLTAAIDALQRQGEVVAQIDPRDLMALKAGRSDVPVFSPREPISGYVNLYALPPQPPTREQTP